MTRIRHNERTIEIEDAIVAAPGIAIGVAVILSDNILYTPEYTIMRSQIEDELNRLNAAIERARQELIARQEELSEHFGKAVDLLDHAQDAFRSGPAPGYPQPDRKRLKTSK